MAALPTLLGTVESVSGGTVQMKLSPETISGLTFIEGRGYRIAQIGAFVRIPLGFTDLYGIVSQIGASAVPERLAAVEVHGNRWATIELIGEASQHAGFTRGLSQFPTIGDVVHLVTEQNLKLIYGRPDEPRYVRIGHLSSAESIPALVDIERLVTRHSAVVGTTGSGKSTTVSGILTALSESQTYPSARVVVVDIHGEYSKALADRATIFRANGDTKKGELPLYVPYWAMSFDELITTSLGLVEGRDRGEVIDRITDLKRAALEQWPRPGVNKDTLNVDTPVPFSINRLWFDLHCDMRATHYEKPGQSQSSATWALELDSNKSPIQAGDAMAAIAPRFLPLKDEKGDPEKIRLSRSTLSLGRNVDALGSRLRDPRYDFMFRPGPFLPSTDGQVSADLDQLLAGWLGDNKPITILDLSGIPTSVQSQIVGTLLRVIYDFLFWARDIPEGGRERPVLVILEEAHAYLNERDQAALTAVKRIAKEGRKYGIGMMLVSQRPSEIDSTILSQCGTLLAMRLTNSTDRQHISGSAMDSLSAIFDALPVLRTGEAIIVGEAVSLPLRTVIDPPHRDRTPDSADPRVVTGGDSETGFEGPGGWNQVRGPENYADALLRWRRQDPRTKDEEPVKTEMA
jgi:hypothetical protein